MRLDTFCKQKALIFFLLLFSAPLSCTEAPSQPSVISKIISFFSKEGGSVTSFLEYFKKKRALKKSLEDIRKFFEKEVDGVTHYNFFPTWDMKQKNRLRASLNKYYESLGIEIKYESRKIQAGLPSEQKPIGFGLPDLERTEDSQLLLLLQKTGQIFPVIAHILIEIGSRPEEEIKEFIKASINYVSVLLQAAPHNSSTMNFFAFLKAYACYKNYSEVDLQWKEKIFEPGTSALLLKSFINFSCRWNEELKTEQLVLTNYHIDFINKLYEGASELREVNGIRWGKQQRTLLHYFAYAMIEIKDNTTNESRLISLPSYILEMKSKIESISKSATANDTNLPIRNLQAAKGDLLSVFEKLEPHALIKDRMGRLPLHYFLSITKREDHDSAEIANIITDIIQNYPIEVFSTRDRFGKIPTDYVASNLFLFDDCFQKTKESLSRFSWSAEIIYSASRLFSWSYLNKRDENGESEFAKFCKNDKNFNGIYKFGPQHDVTVYEQQRAIERRCKQWIKSGVRIDTRNLEKGGQRPIDVLVQAIIKDFKNDNFDEAAERIQKRTAMLGGLLGAVALHDQSRNRVQDGIDQKTFQYVMEDKWNNKKRLASLLTQVPKVGDNKKRLVSLLKQVPKIGNNIIESKIQLYETFSATLRRFSQNKDDFSYFVQHFFGSKEELKDFISDLIKSGTLLNNSNFYKQKIINWLNEQPQQKEKMRLLLCEYKDELGRTLWHYFAAAGFSLESSTELPEEWYEIYITPITSGNLNRRFFQDKDYYGKTPSDYMKTSEKREIEETSLPSPAKNKKKRLNDEYEYQEKADSTKQPSTDSSSFFTDQDATNPKTPLPLPRKSSAPKSTSPSPQQKMNETEESEDEYFDTEPYENKGEEADSTKQPSTDSSSSFSDQNATNPETPLPPPPPRKPSAPKSTSSSPQQKMNETEESEDEYFDTESYGNEEEEADLATQPPPDSSSSFSDKDARNPKTPPPPPPRKPSAPKSTSPPLQQRINDIIAQHKTNPNDGKILVNSDNDQYLALKEYFNSPSQNEIKIGENNDYSFVSYNFYNNNGGFFIRKNPIELNIKLGEKIVKVQCRGIQILGLHQGPSDFCAHYALYHALWCSKNYEAFSSFDLDNEHSLKKLGIQREKFLSYFERWLNAENIGSTDIVELRNIYEKFKSEKTSKYQDATKYINFETGEEYQQKRGILSVLANFFHSCLFPEQKPFFQVYLSNDGGHWMTIVLINKQDEKTNLWNCDMFIIDPLNINRLAEGGFYTSLDNETIDSLR